MASESTEGRPSRDWQMVETRWTQVIRANGHTSEAKLALKDLTAAYYQPVFWFIRERSANEDAARDLTQSFFLRVLERYGFEGADPERGRFRSFLLGAVKHFLSEQHAFATRQKRGGTIPHVSLDALGTETTSTPGLQVVDTTTLPPDEAFDQQWALAVLDRALKRLERDCETEGNGQQFTVLQPWLAGGADTTQAEAAFQLGLSESTVRVVIHRLRQRFRKAVLAELAHTISPAVSAQDEMQYLFTALSSGR